MTIDLYYNILSPPARSVVILAKHLKIDSQITFKELNTYAGEAKTPEFLKLNPSHTIPTLVDNGFALFESRAILAYLANKYAPGGTIYPADPVARAKVDKVLFYDASAFVPSMKAVIVAKYRTKVEPPKETVDDLKEKIAILEAILGGQAFFAGDHLTIADISLSVCYALLRKLEAGLAATPKLEAWYGRLVKALPQAETLNNEALVKLQEMLAEQDAAKK